MRESWWIKNNEALLKEEVNFLEEANMQPEVIEESKQCGPVVIKIKLKVFGEERDAEVNYPNHYPYFRPALIIRGLEALRHYNPVTCELCLLEQGTKHWQPRSMNAASHIQNMLKEWEKVSKSKYSDERQSGEDSQAEPITAYLPPLSKKIMLNGSFLIPKNINSGTIRVAAPRGIKSFRDGTKFISWALEFKTPDGTKIEGGDAPEAIEMYIKEGNYTKFTGPWYRLSSPTIDVKEIINEPNIQKQIYTYLRKHKDGLFGFCMEEENPRGGYRDGWIFLYIRFSKNNNLPEARRVTVEYAGEKEFFERIPELSPLRGKKIAVVGLGCIGAPSVLELARAGIGEIRLWDYDLISPGTICRWPIGLESIGNLIV